MADTLEQLLQGVQAYKSGSEAATQQVIGALSTQAKITSGISDTYKQQATDDVTVALAKNAADHETQMAKVKAANIAGANLKNSTEVISELSAAAQDAWKRKDEAMKAVQAKNEVGLFDNPIKFIANQFLKQKDIAKHEIADFQLKAAENRIAAVNAAAQTTIITQTQIAEPLTAASMEASARSAGVAASVAARQAEIQGISYNTKGIEYALNAKKEVLALGFQVNGAQNAASQLAMSRERMAQDRIEFSFRQKEYQERAEDKEDQKQLGQSFVNTINLGRKALLGPDAAPLDDINGKMALQMLKGKGPMSAEFQKFYDAGERTRLSGKVVIGTTPAAAAATMQAVPVKLNPTQGAVKSVLTQAAVDTNNALTSVDMSTMKQNPVFAGMNPKDKTTIESAYNKRAQQILNEASKVIKPGDSDNPYQIASINQLYSNSPTVRELPVVEKVFAPLIRTGVSLTDPKQILSLVGDAVTKGRITHKEALELSTVYHVGVSANLAMRNMEGFGLTPVNSYNAAIETNPNAWNPSEIVDMTKPDALSRALIKMQASKLQEQLMTGEKSMTPKFNAAATEVINNVTTPRPRTGTTTPAAAAVDKFTDDSANIVDNFFKELPTENKPYFGPKRKQ